MNKKETYQYLIDRGHTFDYLISLFNKEKNQISDDMKSSIESLLKVLSKREIRLTRSISNHISGKEESELVDRLLFDESFKLVMKNGKEVRNGTFNFMTELFLKYHLDNPYEAYRTPKCYISKATITFSGTHLVLNINNKSVYLTDQYFMLLNQLKSKVKSMGASEYILSGKEINVTILPEMKNKVKSRFFDTRNREVVTFSYIELLNILKNITDDEISLTRAQALRRKTT